MAYSPITGSTAPEKQAVAVDAPQSITPKKVTLTLEEAALESGINSWSLRRLIRSRKLAVVRPGGSHGKIYIRRSDLEAFLDRSRVKAIGESRGGSR